MVGAPENHDFDFEVANLLKMWTFPMIFAILYILVATFFLSLVDRDKR